MVYRDFVIQHGLVIPSFCSMGFVISGFCYVGSTEIKGTVPLLRMHQTLIFGQDVAKSKDARRVIRQP